MLGQSQDSKLEEISKNYHSLEKLKRFQYTLVYDELSNFLLEILKILEKDSYN